VSYFEVYIRISHPLFSWFLCIFFCRLWDYQFAKLDNEDWKLLN